MPSPARARSRRRSPAPAAGTRPGLPLFAFKLLVRQGRRAETEPLEAAVAAARPADPDLLESRAQASRGDPEELLRLCEEVLGHDPGAAHAIYYKAVALAQLGRGEEAAALMGLDRFLQHRAASRSARLRRRGGFPRGGPRRDPRQSRACTAIPPAMPPASASGPATFPAAGDRAAAALVGAIRTAIDGYAGALVGRPSVRPGAAAPRHLHPWALVFRRRRPPVAASSSGLLADRSLLCQRPPRHSRAGRLPSPA